MSECKSCLRCVWLVTRDTGYSNYTVIDTDAHCVMCRNAKLPNTIPDELRVWDSDAKEFCWIKPERDKWHATKDGRCELYQDGGKLPYHIDCEGQDLVDEKEGQRLLTEEANAVPLMTARYFKETDNA